MNKTIKIRTTISFLIVLAIGIYLFIPYLPFPPVRNALFYGKLTLEMIRNNFEIQDMFLFGKFYKGMGFSLLAEPFTLLSNINIGLKCASFLGTFLFLFVGVSFFQELNPKLQIPEKYLPLEIFLLGFNPLVMHQWGSGFADSTFSLFLMLIVSATIRLLDKESAIGSVILLYASLLLAFYFKTAGLLFFPIPFACFILFSLYQRKLALSPKAIKALVIGLVISAIIVVLMVKKKLGVFHVNFDAFQFFKETTNYRSAFALLKKGVVFGETICLTFSALLLFLLLKPIRFLKSLFQPHAMICLIFVTLFLGALLMEFGTASNIRYFLPLFPLLVLFVVKAVSLSHPSMLSILLLGIYFAVNTVTVLAYNHPTVHRLIPKNLPVVFRNHDNFRLPIILEQEEIIRTINEKCAKDAILILLDAYYGLGDQAPGLEVFENYQPFREDLKVRYAVSFDQLKEIPEKPFYVWHKYSLKDDEALFKYLEKNSHQILTSDVYAIDTEAS